MTTCKVQSHLMHHNDNRSASLVACVFGLLTNLAANSHGDVETFFFFDNVGRKSNTGIPCEQNVKQYITTQTTRVTKTFMYE